MSLHRFLILSICLCAFNFSALAQRTAADSAISATWLGVQYGANMSGGDLADRFGFLNHVGMVAGYKTKQNLVFAVDGCFIFGNSLRVTGLFDHLVDSKGNITDVNGDVAIVRALPRGMYTNVTAGKIFPVFGSNPNSGIYANIGVGFLAHKIRVETQDHVVPQIELEYKKGYDRLTTGVSTSQFLGYSFMADQGIVNFYAGFYFQQGFTKNRRTINFDSPEIPVSQETRLDLQYGLKACWLIPIYKRRPKDFYYN